VVRRTRSPAREHARCTRSRAIPSARWSARCSTPNLPQVSRWSGSWTSNGRPRVLEAPAVEMPRRIRAGLAWNDGAVPAHVLGLADVTVAAGDFAGCLVIEEAGGFVLKEGTKADVRHFYAPKVGEVFAAVNDRGCLAPGARARGVGRPADERDHGATGAAVTAFCDARAFPASGRRTGCGIAWGRRRVTRARDAAIWSGVRTA